MFLSINSLVRRQRRRLLAFAVVLSLAGVVVLAHSAMGDHMDDGAVMCVAVLQIAAFAAAAVAAGVPKATVPVRWSAAQVIGPPPALLAFPPQPRARAGPAALQVFRL